MNDDKYKKDAADADLALLAANARFKIAWFNRVAAAEKRAKLAETERDELRVERDEARADAARLRLIVDSVDAASK